MIEGTALEIADRLDSALRWTIPIDAASALRHQHAEIERLTADKEVLVLNANHAFDAMQGQQEEIERLTAERDAAIAEAVSAEREACAAVCDEHTRCFYLSVWDDCAKSCAEEIRARLSP